MSVHPLMVGATPRTVPSRLANGWPSLLAGAAALALVTAIAFDSGGYFPASYLAAGAVAFVTLGAILIVRPPHYRVSVEAHIALAGLAALTAWTALSAGWSAAPAAALTAAQLDLTYLGLFGLGLIAAGSGRHAGLLVWGVFAVILVVGVAGLANRLYPDLVAGAAGALPIYRLSYPISYWNAFGAMCAMGLVLGAGLAADGRTPAILRGATMAGGIALAVAIYFSLSRGAWLATAVALVLLIATGPRRGSLLLTIAVIGGAATVAIIRLRHYPALVNDPSSGTGQLRQGRPFARELVELMAAGAALGMLLAAARGPLLRLTGYVPPARAMKVVLGALCAAVAIAGLAVESGPIGGFVGRQWSDFLRPSAPVQVGSARLLDSSGTRSDVYRVALAGFAAHPVIGTGAGSFQSQWFRARRLPQQLINAHSLELETLDELGVVGGLLLVGFLGSIGAAAVRARSTTGALSPARAAAVSAAMTVWLIHSAVDWDWQISALTGTALVLGATLYPFGRVRRRRDAA